MEQIISLKKKKKTECVIVIVLLYKVKLKICGIESERSRKTNIAYQLHVESKKKKKSSTQRNSVEWRLPGAKREMGEIADVGQKRYTLLIMK